MTTDLNPIQFPSTVPTEKKMPPLDHESLAASNQSVCLQPSVSDGRNQSSSQLVPASVLSFSECTLHACFFIALRCSRCGNVRQAVALQPIHCTIACPECALECHFVLLGRGLTKRNLPFHQVQSPEQTRWDHRIEDHRIEDHRIEDHRIEDHRVEVETNSS
jgi:hypothetical protein